MFGILLRRFCGSIVLSGKSGLGVTAANARIGEVSADGSPAKEALPSVVGLSALLFLPSSGYISCKHVKPNEPPAK